MDENTLSKNLGLVPLYPEKQFKTNSSNFTYEGKEFSKAKSVGVAIYSIVYLFILSCFIFWRLWFLSPPLFLILSQSAEEFLLVRTYFSSLYASCTDVVSLRCDWLVYLSGFCRNCLHWLLLTLKIINFNVTDRRSHVKPGFHIVVSVVRKKFIGQTQL